MDRHEASAAARILSVSERPRLHNFYRRHGANSHSEGLAHEAIANFLKTRGLTSNGQPIEDLRAFLWKIAWRVLYRHWRKRPDESLEAEDTGPSHLPALERQLQIRALLNKIQSDPRYQFLVLAGLGWERPELARLRGSTAGALRVHLHKCRKELRAQHGKAFEELLAA